MEDSLNTLAKVLDPDCLSASEFEWESLTIGKLQPVYLFIEQKYKPSTAKKILSALRGLIKAGNAISSYHGVTLFLSHQEVVYVQQEPVIIREKEILPEESLRALIDTCSSEHTNLGFRDAAIIAAICGASLTRRQICALQMRHYSNINGVIVVNSGNGYQTEFKKVGGKIKKTIDRWYVKRKSYDSDPLFVGFKKGGGMTEKRLTEQAVYLIIRKRSKESGLGELSPTDLRRSQVGGLAQD